jgi:meiotically up-regulated gene 157 (Mug157) protein
MKLPLLGLVPENDPVFQRTYQWLHSKDYEYSNQGKAYGLPGSWRVYATCCWSVADHLRLKSGQSQALKILEAATWDGGIVSEMLDPATAEGLAGGGAFATAAGYVAHAIYQSFVEGKGKTKGKKTD